MASPFQYSVQIQYLLSALRGPPRKGALCIRAVHDTLRDFGVEALRARPQHVARGCAFALTPHKAAGQVVDSRVGWTCWLLSDQRQPQPGKQRAVLERADVAVRAHRPMHAALVGSGAAAVYASVDGRAGGQQ